MGSYIPSTPAQRQEMLKAIGLSSFRQLYGDVPAEMYLDRPLNIPSGMSELEVGRAVRAMADKNRVYDVILRGAGPFAVHLRVSDHDLHADGYGGVQRLRLRRGHRRR